MIISIFIQIDDNLDLNEIQNLDLNEINNYLFQLQPHAKETKKRS